jgi:hypothetical protein
MVGMTATAAARERLSQNIDPLVSFLAAKLRLKKAWGIGPRKETK